MKNKFLLTLLAIVCVICCVFALIACNPDDSGDPGSNPNNPNNGDIGNNVDTTNVTAEKWTQLLTALPNAKNYTLGMGDNVSIKLDGDKLQSIMDDQEILSKEGSDYFYYEKKSGSSDWTKESITEQYYNNMMVMWADQISTIATAIKDKFTSFTYADGKYSAATLDAGERLGTLKNVTVVFKNNVFVRAEFTATVQTGPNAQDVQDITYSIKDIGTTSVTLPNVQVSVTNEVTEQQWQEGLAAFAQGKNFHLVLSVSGKTVGEVKLDGDKYYDNGGVERILVKDGNDYYCYEKNGANSQWTRESVTESEYNSIVNENALNLVLGGAQALSQSYSSFEYADGKYVAKVLEVSEEFILKNVQVIFSHGSVAKIVCAKVDVKGSDPDTLVTIDGMGSTQVVAPTDYDDVSGGVKCPIKPNQKINVHIGTLVSELYKQYSGLNTQEGKWELYMYLPQAPSADKDGYVKLADEDAVPSAGEFKCKLVYNGVDKAEDVEFVIVGTDHSYTEKNAIPDALKTAATCQSPAIYYMSCICGLISTNDDDVFTHGDPLPHAWGTEYDSNENGHWRICGNCSATEEATAHTAGDAVIENEVAGCLSDSYDEVVYCSVCHYEISREGKELPATGKHKYADSVVENEVASTCTVKGTYDEVTYCAICGDELLRLTRQSSLADHDLDTTETAATCTSSGEKTESCKNCDYTKTVVLPMLDHVPTAEGTCQNCGTPTKSEGLNLTISGEGDSAHYQLTSIGSCTDSTVYIPASVGGIPVTSIADNAFKDNTDIIAVYFSSAITSIGSGAFSGCTNLEKVVFSNSITQIGSSAFNGCTSLIAANLPDSVQSIGSYAFNNCESLIKIVIGEGVTSIGNYAFWCCRNLETVEFNAVRCNGFTNYSYVFGYGGRNKGGFDIIIGKNCQIIPEYLFNCGNALSLSELDRTPLIKSITFPDDGQCAEIGQLAFAAFYPAHTVIYIPEYVTTVQRFAFGGSTSWTQTGGTGAGQYTYYQDIMLCLEADSVPATYHNDWYQSGTSKSYSGMFVGLVYSYCVGATRTCGVTDGYYWVLKNDNTICVYDVVDGTTDATIPEKIETKKVSEIAVGFLIYNDSVTNVVVPRYVTKIGDKAFGWCYTITRVEIRAERFEVSGYSNYSGNLFYDTGSYNSYYTIIIGENVQAIPMYFINGTGTTNYCAGVIFEEGSSCETIAASAFRNTTLPMLVLPASIKEIASMAFESGGVNRLYYGGTFAEYMNKIPEYARKNTFKNTFVYSYSSNAPTSDGMYWRYENGEPVVVTFVPDESNKVSAGLNYTLSSDSTYYTVTGLGSCTDTEIIIPQTYNSLPVKAVRNYAFNNESQLTNFVLPEGITDIGMNAFTGTGFYTNPDNWESGALYIGQYLIAVNDSLSETYVVKEGTTLIGGYAFNGSAVKHVILPESVEYICYGAFYQASVLETIVMPESYSSLAAYVFYGCVALESEITLPASQTTVYEYTFYNCKAMTGVNLPEGLKAIENRVFYNCESIAELIIPETVQSLGTDCLANCRSLTTLKIPASVTYLPQGVIKGCYGLVSLELPFVGESKTASYQKGVLGYIFSGGDTSEYSVEITQTYYNGNYTSNAYAKLPKSLTTVKVLGGNISSGAFSNCTMLTTVILPESVTYINSRAFYNCTNLMSITVPASVTTISELETFEGCINLLEVCNLSELDIQAGATTYGGIARYAKRVYGADGESGYVKEGDYLFYVYDGGTVLCSYTGDATDVTLPANYNGSPYAIGSGAFYNRSDITSITIPSTVTEIGSYAFYGCTSLVANIVIPDGQTVIGNYTFYNCKAITGITIPSSVTEIGSYAFAGCESLTEITIPASITKIGLGAYQNCKALATLNFNAENVTGYISSSTQIFSGSGCADGVTALIGKDVVKIPNYLFSSTYFKLVSVSFEEGSICETIGENAFQGCINLSVISLPDSLKTIGNSAFSGCSALTELVIPDSVTSIGSSVFYNCSALKTLTLSAELATLPRYILAGCYSLEELTIPYVSLNKNDVTASANTLFGTLFGSSYMSNSTSVYQYYSSSSSSRTSCYIPNSLKKLTILAGKLNYGALYQIALEEVVLGEGVQIIDDYAFDYCSSLKVLTINGEITSIGSNAFIGASALETVNYAAGLESWLAIDFADRNANPINLGANLYFGEEPIESLTVPESVTAIKQYAFAGSGIKSVVLHSGVTEIGEGAFADCYKLYEIYNGSALEIVKGENTYGQIAKYAACVYSSADAESQLVRIDGFLLAQDGDDFILLAYEGSDTEITLPEKLNGSSYSIANRAFMGNQTLTSISVNGATSVGDMAFANCVNLTKIYLGNSITSIGADILYGCSAISEITVPFVGESVKTSSDTHQYPFGYFFGTKSFTNATSVSQQFYDDSVSSTSAVSYYIPKSITKVTILGGSIMRGAFFSISNGTFEVVIGDDVQEIMPYAFRNCSGLTKVTIGNGVETIGEYAFAYCSKLAVVILGTNVKTIGNSAFYYSSALKTVYNLSTLTLKTGATVNGYVSYYATAIYTELPEEE